MRESQLLLSNTGTQVNITGSPVKAAGYYSNGLNFYTAAFYLSNFSGRIYIQASLASDPSSSDTDWFNVKLGSVQDYLEFAPHAIDENNETGTSKNLPLNFTGNFVWLRAKIDRSYLPSPESTVYGAALKALINY